MMEPRGIDKGCWPKVAPEGIINGLWPVVASGGIGTGYLRISGSEGIKKRTLRMVLNDRPMMDVGFADPILLLRQAPEDPAASGVVSEVEEESDEETGSHKAVRCAHCGHDVTTLSEQIEISGAHRHSFANPHGFVFEVGCFNSAAGCRSAGSPSGEFTWFAGYNWRLALCGRCLSHLGWYFMSAGSAGFIALVLDRLVIPEE